MTSEPVTTATPLSDRPAHRGCRTVGECWGTLDEVGFPRLPASATLFAAARMAAALLDERDALRERLRYEPLAGCRIGRALREAQREARMDGHSVFLRFNDLPLTVKPDSDIEAMEARYDEQLTAWHKAKRASTTASGEQ